MAVLMMADREDGYGAVVIADLYFNEPYLIKIFVVIAIAIIAVPLT